jgi:hypothetical protein
MRQVFASCGRRVAGVAGFSGFSAGFRGRLDARCRAEVQYQDAGSLSERLFMGPCDRLDLTQLSDVAVC